MIETSHPLAIRYNDLAVLEHYHAASMFEMMKDTELDIFASFTNDSRKLVREFIIGMVLSTDMAAHFDIIGKFKSKLASTGLLYEVKADKKLCLSMTLKCADVNFVAKNQTLCKAWTRMAMEEYFFQGDQEVKLRMPVSAFMSRATTDPAKCQIVKSLNVCLMY